MKLIIGLGNIGKEYENTRHNAGFFALDAFAATLGAHWSEDTKHKALVAKADVDGTRLLLAKPMTYMNASGEAVQSLSSYYKVKPSDLLVVHDELDLPAGRMAFIAEGGSAGHNGIASIQEMLNRKDIARLRIGIGRPTTPQPIEDFVLGTIEPPTLEMTKKAAHAIQDWISLGIEKSMNQWNRASS